MSHGQVPLGLLCWQQLRFKLDLIATLGCCSTFDQTDLRMRYFARVVTLGMHEAIPSGQQFGHSLVIAIYFHALPRRPTVLPAAMVILPPAAIAADASLRSSVSEGLQPRS